MGGSIAHTDPRPTLHGRYLALHRVNTQCELKQNLSALSEHHDLHKLRF